MAGPKMTDNMLLLSAGINPKTHLPTRYRKDNTNLKEDLKKVIRIIDEQDHANRYKWVNIPCNLTSQEIERLLYYKGQLAFFYYKETNEFYFMPYALDGTIDFYGRFNSIHPVPMSSGTTENEKKFYHSQEQFLSTIVKDVVYGVIPEEDITEDTLYNSCVLLHDYTKQLSQIIIPRWQINDPIIDVMAECIPFMRTSLIAGSGIKGVRVQDADQRDSVDEGSRSLLNSALTGNIWTPIVGAIEFQELTDGQPIKSEEYMISMQSLDNLRLSTYGLENGGLFEKKAHMLESENDVNQSNVNLVYQDGLSIRQHFCNIVNSIWGLGLWCMPSEDVLEQDQDGDGSIYDSDNDSAGTGGELNGEDDDSTL